MPKVGTYLDGNPFGFPEAILRKRRRHWVVLPAQRVGCDVELGVDVLEYSDLISLLGLVECYFPGNHLQFG